MTVFLSAPHLSALEQDTRPRPAHIIPEDPVISSSFPFLLPGQDCGAVICMRLCGLWWWTGGPLVNAQPPPHPHRNLIEAHFMV